MRVSLSGRRPLLVSWHKVFSRVVLCALPPWLSLENMSWRLRKITRSFWTQSVHTLSSLRTCDERMAVISFHCNRTSQCQDRPQSDYRGGPEWERLQLDTNHSQLEVDKQLQRRSGM